MAGLARGRVPRARVLPLVVGLVAGDAIRLVGGIEPDPAARDVAARAEELSVGAHELEAVGEGGVVEGAHVLPGPGRVAVGAIRIEACRQVVHHLGRPVLLGVAGHAFGFQRSVAPSPVVPVTGLAGDLEVGSLQGKPGALVDSEAGNRRERLEGVAASALRPKGPLVDIEMTGRALTIPHFGGIEPQILVAGNAGQIPVLAFQCEPRHQRMPEGGVVLDGPPSLCGVAITTPDPLGQRPVPGRGPSSLAQEASSRSQREHGNRQDDPGCSTHAGGSRPLTSLTGSPGDGGAVRDMRSNPWEGGRSRPSHRRRPLARLKVAGVHVSAPRHWSHPLPSSSPRCGSTRHEAQPSKTGWG